MIKEQLIISISAGTVMIKMIQKNKNYSKNDSKGSMITYESEDKSTIFSFYFFVPVTFLIFLIIVPISFKNVKIVI